MKRVTRLRRGSRQRPRTGVAALEAVLILAVTFPMAMVGFWLARLAAANAYLVISVFVGSPLY